MKTQALGGFQIAAFEAGEEKPSGGALLGQRNGVPVGRFLADTGAADDDAGVAHIARGDEAVHEAAKDDHLESMAEEVFGGGDGDGRCGRRWSRRCIVFTRFSKVGEGEGRVGFGRRRALTCSIGCGRRRGDDCRLVVPAALCKQSLRLAIGGEQALGEGACCGKAGQGVGVQCGESFGKIEALGLRDAPQL